MRTPFTPLSRSFPAEGVVPDGEVRRLLERGGRMRPIHGWLYAAVGVIAGSVWLGAAGLLLDTLGGTAAIIGGDELIAAALAVAVFGGAIVAGFAAALLAWDRARYRAVARELARARCRKCRHTLLGLPVHYTGIGPPLPGEAKVRCPECGHQMILLDMGLRPEDLVPLEQRGVPKDYAKVRKGQRWGRRGFSGS